MNVWREAVCRNYVRENGDNPWLSEHPEERAVAAVMCGACKVIVHCAQKVIEDRRKNLPMFGVWAGEDFSRPYSPLSKELQFLDDAERLPWAEVCRKYGEGYARHHRAKKVASGE